MSPRRIRIRRSERRTRPDERGAALVEFAFLALPLFLILFGTIEFGWTFFQLNDIRHGAREGIRLVVVNADVDPAYGEAEHGPMTKLELLSQAACERMDQRDGTQIAITFDDADTDGTLEVGDDVLLKASKPLDQLTMVFDTVLAAVVLDEAITSRMEQSPPTGISADVEYVWSCR